MEMKLPENFRLGASASAEQTEGWKGKKPGQDSYMDAWFINEPNTWHGTVGPDVATGFMDNYKIDFDLMKEFGVDTYRTSINWSRFFTDYENCVVDEEYAQHISDMIDAQIADGVEPMLCLHHYELPWELWDKQNGWANRHVCDLFERYAEIVFERYADRVKTWFAFNEPNVCPAGAFLNADAWPHEQDTAKWLRWNYGKILSTALAVRAYKKGGYDGRIGTIINVMPVYPRSSSAADREAARMADLFENRMYLDPHIFGEYPEELANIAKANGIWFDPSEEDLRIIRENTIQVLGVNTYFPGRVQAPRYAPNPAAPFHPSRFYEPFVLPGCEMNTSRGWEIYPEILHDVAMLIKDRYGNIPWLITENGMGVEGEEAHIDENGMVHDDYRIDFVTRHMASLLRAIEEGANCEGYLLWSFTDCISPRNAFKNRYGYIRIDVENGLARVPKKSAYWHKDLAETRVLKIGE